MFAVLNYAIAKQQYDRAREIWMVRLNPKLLAMVLGESEPDVEKAIKFLCGPDDNSTSKREGGRRLVECADQSYEYRVVNGDIYQDRRDYEMRKEQNREAKRRERGKGKPTKAGAEAAYQRHVAGERMEMKEAAAAAAGESVTFEECKP